MTSTTPEVRDYAMSPALAVTLPPPSMMPAALAPLVADFADKKATLRRLEQQASSVASRDRDGEAASADHALLAEGKPPTNVAELTQARGTCRAQLIDARQAVHDTWYDSVQPALAEHRPDLLVAAAAQVRAASATYEAAVRALLTARRDWARTLQFVSFATRKNPQSWYDGDDGGTSRVGKVEVRPIAATEAVGRFLAEIAAVRAALDDLVPSDAGPDAESGSAD